jgi:hypothetical protein
MLRLLKHQYQRILYYPSGEHDMQLNQNQQPRLSDAFALLFMGVLLTMLVLGGCTTAEPPPPTNTPDAAVITPPIPPEEGELPVIQIREFECLGDQVGAGMPLMDVENGGGDTLSIRAAGDVPCKYDLLYGPAAGRPEQISMGEPGGYLITAATRFSSGHTVVCASNIHHYPTGIGNQHAIDGVTVECGAHDGTTWLRLQTVLEPDGEWAPWVDAISQNEADSNQFVITYRRDFSFQFLNLSDRDRPETDGIYELRLTLRDGAFEVTGSEMTTSLQNPLRNSEATGWDPTPEEIAEYGDLIDFSGGPCQEGCPVEDDEPPPGS